MQKIFGTDGIRGVYGEDITPELAYNVGRAIAIYIKDKNKDILIAKDTRLSCDVLLSSFVAGATSMGVNVVHMGICSTPALAYTTKVHNFGCGIMITASHNSQEYNGIKVFKGNGEKLGESEEKVLTDIFDNLQAYSLTKQSPCGKFISKPSLIHSYLKHLKKIIKGKYYDLSVAFDCSNGATNKILSQLFEDNFKKLYIINTSMSGKKVNENCGATSPTGLSEFVKNNNLDLGFAFDGDGDRVIMVGKGGEVFDGDDILYNLAKCLKSKNKLKANAVVGTIMTNLGVERALSKEGIALYRVSVGDKYIVDKLKADSLVLGGEKAGHIIPYDYTNTGDGVLTSLIILEAFEGKFTKVKNLPQELVNLPCKKEVKEKLFDSKSFALYLENLEKENSDYRVVVRPSGTENKIRVMVEGASEQKVKGLSTNICSYIQKNFL